MGQEARSDFSLEAPYDPAVDIPSSTLLEMVENISLWEDQLGDFRALAVCLYRIARKDLDKSC